MELGRTYTNRARLDTAIAAAVVTPAAAAERAARGCQARIGNRHMRIGATLFSLAKKHGRRRGRRVRPSRGKLFRPCGTRPRAMGRQAKVRLPGEKQKRKAGASKSGMENGRVSEGLVKV